MSPENSILNFHTSWIWILQCLQGLQVKHLPSNNTLLSRPNKQHTIWCFWHCSNLAPNFSTPVDARSNPKAPPYIHSLSLLVAIRYPHPQIYTHTPTHTPQSLHLSTEETSTHAKLWAYFSGAKRWLEGLEGTKMDVKWQCLKRKYWIDGRGKRWSATVHWCNIMQVDLFYVNSCIEYFQGFKSLQQKEGPLKEYVNICQVWKFFPSSSRQDYVFIGSLTVPGSAIWAGLHEAVCTSPQGTHDQTHGSHPLIPGGL